MQRKSVISDQTDSWNQGIWNWSGNRFNWMQGNILMSSTIQFSTEPSQVCTKWKRTGLKQQHSSFRTCRKYRISHILEEKKIAYQVSTAWELDSSSRQQTRRKPTFSLLSSVYECWDLFVHFGVEIERCRWKTVEWTTKAVMVNVCFPGTDAL